MLKKSAEKKKKDTKAKATPAKASKSAASKRAHTKGDDAGEKVDKKETTKAKSAKVDTSAKAEKSVKVEKSAKAEKGVKVEKSAKAEKGVKVETSAKAKISKADKAGKSPKAGKNAKPPKEKPVKARKDTDGEATEAGERNTGKSLVVVESPAKAKTIKKYLGNAYTVRASVGHIKDLPKRSIGVDPDKDFEAEYDIITGKKEVVKDLRDAAAHSDRVFLAPDPDREGEAIAWHIKEELEDVNSDIMRVKFNEITPKAVQEALAHPQQLDLKRYESQQARRILDRLVGYQISPILWKKVRRGLSAGRVQSVAVRIVVERERAINAFKPEEYWTLDAELEKPNVSPHFVARAIREKDEKLEVSNAEQAQRIHDLLEKADFVVAKVDKKERQRRAPAPFITSKLQQDAANRLHFSAKKTMQLAQQLYEGVELGAEGSVGLITYMRTDSTRLSDDALKDARGFIEATYGKEYLPQQPNVFKTKSNAQDAHEAIRPTSLKYTPESVEPFLDKDQQRLYRLIWDRFVACQMMPAKYDQTSVDVAAGDITLRVAGSVLKFAGFLKVYGEVEDEGAATRDAREQREDEERDLPELTVGDKLNLIKLLKEQHFTQPPPRFSEATLVKELEENGIGRPSTYAAILSTIVDKGYVLKDQNRFKPTELGTIVTDLLIESFPDIMDVQFTAAMEGKLDAVEEGEQNWKTLLHEFYSPFRKSLDTAQLQMRDVKRQEVETEHVCEKCGGKMVIKWGKNGSFLACKNYPECKNTRDMKRDSSGELQIVQDEMAGENCPKCGSPMVIKNGRFGRFVACSRYPECRTTKPISTGVSCPECNEGYVSEKRSKRGKIFFGCSRWPDCSFVAWDRPVKEPCPACHKPFLVQKITKRGKTLRCVDKECGYSREVAEPSEMEETGAPAVG